MNATRPLLEVCIDDPASAAVAEAGGADRIELCHDLSVGGTSPSPESMQTARASCALPIVAMVRPRGGPFRYDAAELGAMEDAIERARDSGMAGVVLGVLDGRKCVDPSVVERLVTRAGTLPVTFHRAFDETPDPDRALDVLIELGVARVLTSGAAPTAVEGTSTLARLVERAAGRIVVMPGGGVRAANAAGLCRTTGARELHTSAGHPEPLSALAVRRIRDALANVG